MQFAFISLDGAKHFHNESFVTRAVCRLRNLSTKDNGLWSTVNKNLRHFPLMTKVPSFEGKSDKAQREKRLCYIFWIITWNLPAEAEKTERTCVSPQCAVIPHFKSNSCPLCLNLVLMFHSLQAKKKGRRLDVALNTTNPNTASDHRVMSAAVTH